MPRFLAGFRRSVAWAIALIAAVTGLWLMPGRSSIPPRIEQDNAYTFLAVDRLCDGQGLTAIPPKAPFQDWTWRSDWAVLTQWPAGYPLLIATVRTVLGTTTAEAATALNILFCGIAMVAWFALARAMLPRGVAAWMLAIVVAVSSVSMEHLIHPSSDTILVAMLPVVLLLSIRLLGLGRVGGEASEVASVAGARDVIVLGVVAGSLVWIRYASVFVPIAIGAFLLFDWLAMRRRTMRDALIFALAAGFPMVALIAFNRVMGDGASAQEQFNLGNRLGFDFSFSMIGAAWQHWTAQTLYAYRPEAKLIFGVGLPLFALAVPMLFASSRHRFAALFANQRTQLLIASAAALVTVLVTASTLFKGKFDYVGLARYYDPIRPIYLLLFLAPFVIWNRWFVRGAAGLVCVFAISWFVQQDAMRTRDRWLAADRSFTEYGRWDHRFGANSCELYSWVGKQAGPGTIVFSNFHDDIALETGMPVSPMPESRGELGSWLVEIRKTRQVNDLRVMFVLEFEDDSRDYFQKRPENLIADLGLVQAENTPDDIKKYVFVPDSPVFVENHNPF